MNKILWFFIFIWLLFSVSCKKEHSNPNSEPYIDVQDSLITTSVAGDTVLKIRSHISWVASSKYSFVTLTPDHGAGDATIHIHYTANDTHATRTDSITITSGNLSKTVYFKQATPLYLISSTSSGAFIDDSLSAVFNKPIKVISITASSYACDAGSGGELGYRYINSSTGLKYRYSCVATLGQTYQITITVKDNDGNILSQKINFNTFTASKDLGGTIISDFFSQDNKSVWIYTKTPNVIYQLSSADFSVINQMPLSYEAIRVKLNPYNNLLYILTSGQYIYVVDPSTGLQVKKIPVTYSDLNGNVYPVAFDPNSDLGFTSTGYGIIVYPIASTTNAWQIIDTQHGDKLSVSPDYVFGNSDFQAVYNSFDNSKLFMTGLYGDCQLSVFTGSTQKLQRVIPTAITRDVFITPNKKNDNIYFGQLYNQFIMDLNLNISKISFLDNRANGSADFCYLPGKESHIYFSCDDYFVINDYANAITVMSIYAPFLRGCMTTVDGKYLFMYNGSVLYQFNTSMFNN